MLCYCFQAQLLKKKPLGLRLEVLFLASNIPLDISHLNILSDTLCIFNIRENCKADVRVIHAYAAKMSGAVNAA